MVHSFTSLATEVIRTACATHTFVLPNDISVAEPPAHIAGDVATNVALKVAGHYGGNPREIAELLAVTLPESKYVEKAEVAGPGFLNITFSDEFYRHIEADIEKNSAEQRVQLPVDQREKIDVEFVSANPSGPLHVGNARGGPLGEAIVRVLKAQGHDVVRDFYFNDVGGQADVFGASVLHFYGASLGREFPFPENGYKGDYVKEIAAEVVQAHGDSFLQGDDILGNVRKVATDAMVANIKATLDRQGIYFDRWYRQSDLRSSGKVSAVLQKLRDSGHAEEHDGALWLKAGVRDDDRETVLVKSNGVSTYFADDLAYHYEKLVDLGAARGIVLLGADHSGHPPRMRAGVQALGFKAEQYQAVVYQYVQLKENGETVGMAKREGKFVTADDVLDQVPNDVFSYFMVSKANETHVDFDLQLAKDTSEKNPVYSIQYAHARINRLLTKAAEQGMTPGELLAQTEHARSLLRQLSNFQDVVAEAAEGFRINLIAQYLTELSARFHAFYAAERFINAEDAAGTANRLALASQVKATIAFGLNLLNISAPDSLEREEPVA